MRKILARVAALVVLVSPVAVPASEQAIASYQPCAACHGARAEGNPALDAPALAGQGAAYLKRQMIHFKTGVRGSDPTDTLGAQMRAMAANLSDEDIAVLGDYLADLPRPAAPAPAAADMRNGNNFYQAKCGACHGGKASGNPALNSPGLAWLDAAYLKRQYLKFQRGLRGTHPEDRYGRQMKMMTNSLPGERDLDDVIAYIQSLADTDQR